MNIAPAVENGVLLDGLGVGGFEKRQIGIHVRVLERVEERIGFYG